ncbi:unnamed protein product [Alternaria alternata]
MVVKALRSAGHEVIDWQPPSHRTINDTGFNSWIYDAGKDVRSAFVLSGEPMAPQVSFYQSLEKEYTASEIAAINVEVRRLKKEYMEYWNSTVDKTGTEEKYKYYGYSTWVNTLDYTSVVVPVTDADKSVDKKDEGYKAIAEQDKRIQDDYDPEIYDGAHVSVQLVGRRLQEEKMLAVAEYVGGLLHA